MNNRYTKTLVIVFLMSSFLQCKSQTVIIWGQKNPNLPDNFLSTGQYYYKDVHNYLLPFVGTWEYVNGNEKFQIILTKITKYHTVIPDLNYNHYEDGISLQYKKFVNGNLIFESPNINEPTFKSKDGLELEGNLTDYGRVTQTVYKPQQMGGGVWKQGGEYFYPRCSIEKVMTIFNEPAKIKFHLYFFEHSQMFASPYDNPIYIGQPFFSIPNDIIMTKVP